MKKKTTDKKAKAVKKKTTTKKAAPVKKKTAKKRTTKSIAEQQNRETIYTTVEVRTCKEEFDSAITSEIAKQLLGWNEEVPKDVVEGVLRFRGRTAYLENNVTNRPIYNSNLLMIKQDILRKRWIFNGETIIIGRTGLILDGQHSLIALVLAVEEWLKNPETFDDWDNEPFIEKIVVYGVDEDNETVNTINTGKPRTVSDIIYRSELFVNMLPSERQRVSGYASESIKWLWDRTGAKDNAFGITRSPSEAFNFIENHPRIVDCVKHIYEEDGKEKSLTRLDIKPGMICCLLFLQATSKTTEKGIKDYFLKRNEFELDFSLWDEACDFWVELAADSSKMKHLRSALENLQDVEDGANRTNERINVICKAWIGYLKGKITEKSLELDYRENTEEQLLLTEFDTIGGIDLGTDAKPEEPEPDKDQIEERKTVEDKKRTAKKKTTKGTKKKKPAKKKKSTSKKIKLWDQVWVDDDPNGEPWRGKLTETYDGPKGTVAKIELDDKRIYEAPFDTLTHEEPERSKNNETE